MLRTVLESSPLLTLWWMVVSWGAAQSFSGFMVDLWSIIVTFTTDGNFFSNTERKGCGHDWTRLLRTRHSKYRNFKNIVTWESEIRPDTHQVPRELEVDRLETRKLLHQQWNTGGPYSLQGVDRLPRTISREIITSCPGSSKPVFQEISRLDHRIGQRIKQTQKAILHQSWSCGKFWERWSVTFLVCIGYHQGYFF